MIGSGVRGRLSRVVQLPAIQRVGWYLRQARGRLDRRVGLVLLGLIAFTVLTAALIIISVEADKGFSVENLAAAFYWGVNTVLGSGDPTYVTTPLGGMVSWLLTLTGLVLLAAATGLLIGFVIDFLLKEGQGMGAAGYRDHIVVCGWNPSARELIAELRRDDYPHKVVLIHRADRNPAGSDVYYVRGDATDGEDLRRAGVEHAFAALVFPSEPTDEADMRSILKVMAIESIAPSVRTVVEVNNPRHVEHLRRAKADEVLVTSRLASRLLARSSLYPGLTELVMDIVSGGEGSELYRISIPDEYQGLAVNDLSARLRTEHRATLLSVSRGGVNFVNPPADFVITPGGDALVVAEGLGTLAPLKLQRA